MTPIPPDFAVTDAHREYAIQKGWPKFLPDQWVGSFRDVFDAERGGIGKKHKNWDLTFYRYLRHSSPSGDFYRADLWERRHYAAAQQERDESRERPVYRAEVQHGTPAPAAFREMLAAMKEKRA